MIQSVLPQLTFSFYRHQPIHADFSGGQITSDAGLLPLRAFEQGHHLTRDWAAGLSDPRQDDRVRHDSLALLRPSGSYVVFNAPGMRDFTTKFDVAPPGPAATPFEVIIEPASTGYLPRRAQVAMLRTVKPDDPNSVMVPQDIPVYMAPSGTLLPNWAVVRVAVKKAGTTTDERLPWTVLRITRDSDAALLATGMSDKRGEAVLAVAGLGQSANQNGGGAVVATTVDATVTGLFDPNNLQQPKDWLPDPDTVLHNLGDATLKKNTKAVKIGRGTLSVLTMEINL